MKLKQIRDGQDLLIRSVRHLANRAAVIRQGQLYWLMGPEAEADGIMTACWKKLAAIAASSGQPRRSKATPTKKDRQRQEPLSIAGAAS